MSTIADLVIRLTADSSAAEKDMRSFTGKVGGTFRKALVPAVGILGGLGVAAKKAADTATNLGESQNAVNVVFGDSAKTISNFARVADKEAGLSMRQLNELVTPIGASLINTGDSADVAARKSVNLAKRAADMASVFNVDVSEALAAIQAGLRGEADPLERFGVGLNDAAVRAKAVAMGLAKTTQAVDDADKAQARYALILEQTSKLQGDFKNTSDSAANAARINAAAQENLQAKLGQGVLPVVQTYQAVVAKVTAFMAEHTEVVKVAVGILGGLAAAVLLVNAATAVWTAAQKVARVATLAWTGAQWLLNAALTSNPIGLVIVALAALGAAIVVAWKKSETFRRVVTDAWNAIRATTVAVFDAIKSFFQRWWPLILGIATGGLGLIVALVIRNWGSIKSTTSTAWNGITGVVSGAVGAVRSAVSAGFNAVANAVTGAVNRVRNIVSTVFGALAGIVREAVAAVRGGVAALVSAFSPVLDALGAIKSAAGSAAGAIQSVLNVAGKVGSVVGKVRDVAGALPGFASGVRNFAGGLAVVGERGPELVNLPRGSNVYTNAESRGMLRGGTDEGGDVVLVLDGEVLARFTRRELDRKGRRNVGLTFGGA